MSEPLPLYAGARPCVGSGFCCKKRPCSWGKWNETRTQCEYLTEVVETRQQVRHTCGIAKQILDEHGWQVEPAFGAGCCAALGNTAREAIIAENLSLGLAKFDSPNQPPVERLIHNAIPRIELA